MVNCTGSKLGYGSVEEPANLKPQLQTLLELVDAPRANELPNPYGEPGHCEVKIGKGSERE
jgi:hypothetical protein